MKNCTNLFFLSTLACQLADCLSEKEASNLAADLVVLSDMLTNLQTRAENCETDEAVDECNLLENNSG